MFIAIFLCFYFQVVSRIKGQGDVCENNPCQNAGICRQTSEMISNITTYKCTCRPYFTGENCQISLISQNACFSFPCQHGGTCFGSSSTYRCECPRPWTGQQCNIGECPEPETPNNGIRHGNDVTFGSKVSYSCQDGYRLIGAAVLLCLTNQTWSHSVPDCQWNGINIEPATKDPLTPLPNTAKIEGVMCPDPGQPSHGYRIGDVFAPGSSVNFECDDGYVLVGKTPLYCLATGNWHQGVPHCQEKSSTCYTSGSVAAAATVPIVLISGGIIIAMFVIHRHRVKTRWLRAVKQHRCNDPASAPRLSSISNFSFAAKQTYVNRCETDETTDNDLKEEKL